jgi:hypothetical protein
MSLSECLTASRHSGTQTLTRIDSDGACAELHRGPAGGESRVSPRAPLERPQLRGGGPVHRLRGGGGGGGACEGRG